ncbi:transglycosylase domain-containing protein [Streptomyces sp. OfavH-34-F]|uniref:transglycosylase domain-containing protein n=1 Tax=Streptomyces sp. OfavH-34-F TaxID=2917760 RepID=UPI001EF258E2|nr:transglycosylase domain-containing protein [Streptomyces sp. OfavH-34-F]MCG7527523.1 transglycosylase domain-containing protein [Streptomyces sp. OfavH-34-F]
MGRAEARRAQRQAERKGGIRRFLTWRKLLGTAFGVILLGMGAFAVLYVVVDVPEGNPKMELQANVYKYADGSLLARTGEVNREIVSLAEVPKEVQDTFVAAENKSFYKDHGVDLKGTARGLLNTVSGKGKQGGSTITQQYVKNYYLDQDQTVTRKLKELVISLKVDQKKTKKEILAGYINTSYFGRGAWGIQAAAQAYYGVDAKDLDVSQGAYLAALLQAPSQYDWAVAGPNGKRLVKARWAYTLDNMVEEGWLDAGKRKGLTFPVPREPKPLDGTSGQKGYIVDAARKAVLKETGLSDDQFDRGGWTITVSIDKKKQRQLEKSVEAKLLDKLDPEKRKLDQDIQAGAVSVNPKTGAVVALYGGRGQNVHWTSNATRADFQPASTFKPVILAAALDNESKTQNGERITANTRYDGTSRRPVVGSDIPFNPENEDDQNYGQVTVQTAMNKSINSAFAQMGVDVGMDKVMKTAGRLGMDVEKLDAVPAQTLGSMGASPLQMAGVYATLDNHGKKVTPQIVKTAVHQGDAPLDLPDAVGDQVISRQAADSVTSVLTGVVDDGTARMSVRNAEGLQQREIAGKTGTSDDNKSAWFTGYTPDLVTSVGLFGEAAFDRTGDDGKKIKKYSQVTLKGAGGGGRVNGGGFPAEIWADYMAHSLGTPKKFDLDTDMGAAVSPPPASHSPSPSTSPSDDPTPSHSPSSQAPSSEPPPVSESPQSSPPASPSDDTSNEPDPDPSADPGPSASVGLPDLGGNSNKRPDDDGAMPR